METTTLPIVVVRKINPLNRADSNCLKRIDRDPIVKHWMQGGDANDEEIEDYTSNSRGNKIWGVATKKARLDNESKLYGWVRFYYDEEKRLQRTKKGKMLLGKGVRVWETSFAKIKTAPKHTMSRGVKIACKKMLNKSSSGKIAIVAYASQSNKKSIYLLKSCGFEHCGRTLYTGKSKKADHFYVLNNRKYLN